MENLVNKCTDYRHYIREIKSKYKEDGKLIHFEYNIIFTLIKNKYYIEENQKTNDVVSISDFLPEITLVSKSHCRDNLLKPNEAFSSEALSMNS